MIKPNNRKITKRLLIIFMSSVLGLLIFAYGLLQLVNLRTYQFFGGLIDHIDTDQKVIALTFDDAPTPHVEEVLKILKTKNIKATFFAIGSAIEQYPGVAKNIVSSGMEMGNHSYSHDRMVFKSRSFYQEELEKTDQLIRAAGFKGPIHFRPPYGKKLLGLPWYLHQHTIKTIMWDVEPDTYVKNGESNEKKAQFLLNYIVENTKPGSIILLHPFCDQECVADRQALPQIIDALQAKGYTFVTVSELLNYQKKE